MKIYVAAKFDDSNIAWTHNIQRALRDQGHTITHDWTKKTVDEVSQADLPYFLHRCALDNVRGVADADALVLLAHPQSRGAYVELGAALALGKPVFVVKLNQFDTLFFHHPAIRECRDDAQLLHVFRYMPGANPS